MFWVLHGGGELVVNKMYTYSMGNGVKLGKLENLTKSKFANVMALVQPWVNQHPHQILASKKKVADENDNAKLG